MIFIANSTNLKKQPNQKDTTFRQDTLSIAGQSVTENSVVTQSTDIASTALSTERILPTSNTTGKVSWQFAFYIDSMQSYDQLKMNSNTYKYTLIFEYRMQLQELS